MDRQELIQAILKVECDFPLDFTPEYLEGLTDVKLRHIYTALRPHSRKTT